jgi:chromosome segregation ATPase
MTGEELERAIDFLLKSQANLEAQSARTDDQLRQLTVRVDSLADIQTNLVQVVTQHVEEQTRINASLRETDAALARLGESLFASHARLGDSLFASNESLRASLESQAGINDSLRASQESQAGINESLRASQESQARINESLRASQESLSAALAELAARQARTEDALARLAEAQASAERRLGALIGIVEEGRKGGG